MESTRVVLFSDLSPTDFQLGVDNLIYAHGDGGSPTRTVQAIQLSDSVVANDTDSFTVNRNRVITSGTLISIKLDFKAGSRSERVTVATLPTNITPPLELVETQVFDGKTVWIDAGSRDIQAMVRRHRRYVANLSFIL